MGLSDFSSLTISVCLSNSSNPFIYLFIKNIKIQNLTYFRSLWFVCDVHKFKMTYTIFIIEEIITFYDVILFITNLSDKLTIALPGRNLFKQKKEHSIMNKKSIITWKRVNYLHDCKSCLLQCRWGSTWNLKGRL